MNNILWVDDEIELLKPHIIYLQSKGYNLTTAKSGDEALEIIEDTSFNLIFLDENMPGLSGLETLNVIKDRYHNIPVIMITKSEEESIMEEAIGSKISDYLIKPVNPNQILLTIKKNLDSSRLVDEKITKSYQQEFRNISLQLSSNLTFEEWYDVYKKIIYWELELSKSNDNSIDEIISMQKSEANSQFFRFVSKNYESWINDINSPLLSHNLMEKKVFPYLNKDSSVYMLLIDNLRYDQWKIIEDKILEKFKVIDDDMYMSILPTSTQYSRNSIFSGLKPSEIASKYPKKWLNDEDEGGKNMFEEDFLIDQLSRNHMSDFKSSYTKITNIDFGRKVINKIDNMKHNNLNVIVYNFVDMLSHARTEMKVIKELADDDSAYRSLTASWFEHSPLNDIISKIAQQGSKVIITTDHGTINVNKPSKVIGDKKVNPNLRYKQGKNLNYISSDVFEVNDPLNFFLPKQNISSKYIFAKEDLYFVYQNNYNKYVNFYKNTYQHGGVSLEEMLLPIIVMEPK
tara:strand:+ start:1271 stop:2815 length:1545 start_codon:yes stop_codon:yes gene_type:complete